MKTIKAFTLVFALLINFSVIAGNIIITSQNGQRIEAQISTDQIRNKGIQTGREAITYFENITEIETSSFQVHERLQRKIERRYSHIKLEYTGQENIHELRLKKLNNRRKGADVTRAAGGIMTIIGVLSGDRSLTAAGIATNAAGHIARDINNDNTRATQNDMIRDIEKRTQALEQEKSEEDFLIDAYGKENVEGLR